jgi:hypothetical protein
MNNKREKTKTFQDIKVRGIRIGMDGLTGPFMLPVPSTIVSHVGVDATFNTLAIRYKDQKGGPLDGLVYEYYGVPGEVSTKILSSPSIGGALHQLVLDNGIGNYTRRKDLERAFEKRNAAVQEKLRQEIEAVAYEAAVNGYNAGVQDGSVVVVVADVQEQPRAEWVKARERGIGAPETRPAESVPWYAGIGEPTCRNPNCPICQSARRLSQLPNIGTPKE